LETKTGWQLFENDFKDLNRTIRKNSQKVEAMQVEYKNIDPKLVANEIRNGRSLESVQKLFGIKFKSEVQDLYMRGLMELGEIPDMDFNKKPTQRITKTVKAEGKESERKREKPEVRRREKSTKPVLVVKTPNFRTIGQSGSITLNKVLLIEQLGFSIGDSFEICREGDRIILQKIENPDHLNL
jgi:hypothetical protein